MARSIQRLFFSANDGDSFSQMPQPNRALPYLGLRWWSAVFTSAKDGVAVVGATRNYLLYTKDGGRTWARAALGRIPVGQDVVIGTPLTPGKSLELPVFTAPHSSTGPESVSLLVSHNDGASFTGPLTRPVVVIGATVPGPVPVAIYDNTIWVTSPESRAFRSSGNDSTWTSMALPFQGTDAVGISSPAVATIIAGGGFHCATSKRQPKCSRQAIEVWRTNNYGETWHNVTPD